VKETNRYYHKYLDTLDEGCSPLPDVTIQEMYLVSSIIVQMGHDERQIQRLLVTLEQFFMAFYGNTMKLDIFFHILRFLYFSDNKNEPHMIDEHYDRLWKMRIIFDKLNDVYTTYYSPTEHLAVHEVIVLIKGRVIFKQHISKKHKQFGIKIYKLCDPEGYTYNMSMYLTKDRKHATATMTANDATVTGQDLIQGLEIWDINCTWIFSFLLTYLTI
jgi:hypothetical protein